MTDQLKLKPLCYCHACGRYVNQVYEISIAHAQDTMHDRLNICRLCASVIAPYARFDLVQKLIELVKRERGYKPSRVLSDSELEYRKEFGAYKMATKILKILRGFK